MYTIRDSLVSSCVSFCGHSNMRFLGLHHLMMIWVVIVASLVRFGDSKFAFDAIFNFGSSTSDTGGLWAAFPPVPPPRHYGMTYFNRPAGRAADGRLIIDFIAEAVGFPFLSPYLKSINSEYKHGANFATIGSTVLPPKTFNPGSGLSPFPLNIQLDQMKEFKAQAEEDYPKENSRLPNPEVFGKSLFTIYIGQNDFPSNFASKGINGSKQHFRRVVSQITHTIKELYLLGGRMFLVQNFAPIGCFPMFLVILPHNRSDIDAFGCLISYNNAVVEYNKLLKKAVLQTRRQLQGANIIYADTHTVFLELFRHPASHGFKYSTKACCGHGGGAYNFNPQAFCGSGKVIKGKNITATACADPNNYVNWDGIHATEAANKIIANAILSGIHSDPPSSIHCAY